MGDTGRISRSQRRMDEGEGEGTMVGFDTMRVTVEETIKRRRSRTSVWLHTLMYKGLSLYQEVISASGVLVVQLKPNAV